MNPMNIDCPFCGKNYQIDGKKIREKKVRVKCKACGHFITVDKPVEKAGESDETDRSPSDPGISLEKAVDDVAPAPGQAAPPSEEEASNAKENEPRFPREEHFFEEDDWPPFPSDEESPDAANDAPLFSAGEAGSFVVGDESFLPGEEEIVTEPVFKDETAETDLVPKSEKVGLFNRLQFRISAVLLPLTTIILAGFAVHAYITTTDRISKDLNASARITATRLAMHLEPSLLNREDAKAGDAINAEMPDKNIYAILVRNRDGKSVFSARRRNTAWKSTPSDGDIRGNYIQSRKDVFDHVRNEKIGSVEVYLTTKFREEALSKSILNIVITALILIATIFIALTFIIRKMVVRPIMKLTHNAEMMSLGDLRVDIDIASKNEIGLLAQAIDRMQGSLRVVVKRMRGRRRT